MGKRRIRTIAGLQRTFNARNKQSAKLYLRPHLLRPALERHLDRLNEVQQIEDAAVRFEAFRRLPALEYELEIINAGLAPRERLSRAQRDRAARPRVRLTENGATMKMVIFDLVRQDGGKRQRKAKEYWLPLCSRLRELGLNPRLTTDRRRPAREILEYEHRGKRRSLTLAQFANIVSSVRRRLATVH
jgi:hypothetical protein